MPQAKVLKEMEIVTSLRARILAHLMESTMRHKKPRHEQQPIIPAARNSLLNELKLIEIKLYHRSGNAATPHPNNARWNE